MAGSAACSCSAGCVRVDLERSCCVTVCLVGSAVDAVVLGDDWLAHPAKVQSALTPTTAAQNEVFMMHVTPRRTPGANPHLRRTAQLY
jgi:hypothetical protein